MPSLDLPSPLYIVWGYDKKWFVMWHSRKSLVHKYSLVSAVYLRDRCTVGPICLEVMTYDVKVWYMCQQCHWKILYLSGLLMRSGPSSRQTFLALPLLSVHLGLSEKCHSRIARGKLSTEICMTLGITSTTASPKSWTPRQCHTK